MRITKGHLCAALLVLLATTGIALWVVRADTTISYSFVDRGGVSLITRGGTNSSTVGYARVQPNSQNTAPAGVAIFGFRQNGILVTEAGVPASQLIQSGRIYAEVNGPVNTGIAIANPNPTQATISFYFTNSNGVDFGAGTKTIPANGQFASFLNEAPFNSGSSVTGTLTFTSSLPVAVIALRGFTNERSEFLITTLPVIDLGSGSSNTAIIPHFADGGGWTTQVVLVNSGDSPLSGTVQFLSQGTSAAPGVPLSLTVNGQTGTSFNYSVQRRSSLRLRTSGASASAAVGSIRVTPASGVTPAAFVIFSFVNNGFTVSEAGASALQPSTALRLYAEVSDPPSSIRTGFAIANPSSSPATVTFELTSLAGGSPIATGSATIPANGQLARFLDEIGGLGNVSRPFKGILRISSATSITVVGLRSRVNERGDLLITTTPPSDETVMPQMTDTFFPHFVDNGGYTTQFIVFSGSDGQQAAGVIRIFGQNGQPLDLSLVGLADLGVTQTDSPHPVAVNNTLTYTITVTNYGPGQSNSVRLTDTLPSNVSFINATATQGSCSTPIAGVLTCDMSDIRPGANATATVTVVPSTIATLTNSVSVISNEDDPNPGNNRNIIQTPAAAPTDLEVIQTSLVSTCNLGGSISSPTPGDCANVPYSITVTNHGPAASSNVIFTDFLPTDPPSGFVVATRTSLSITQGSCGPVTSDRFICNLGPIASGAMATINVAFSIDPTALGQRIANRVTVSSNDVVDIVPENNTTAAPDLQVTPGPPPIMDLGVTPTWGAPAVTHGVPVALTIPVINNGPSTATSATVATIFSGFSGVISIRSATTTQGTCSIQGSVFVVCNVGTLIRNAQKQITIMVVPSTAGQLKALVSVTGTEQDRDPSNDMGDPGTVTVN
jgi:uncharacterized repeat protein (TIGR01451 family)